MHQELSPRSSMGTRRLTTPTKLQDTNTTQQKIKFSSISCGRTHVIGLARDGSLWHWSNHIMLQPIQLETTEKIVQVVGNWTYSTVLTNEGSIYLIPAPDHIIPSEINQEPSPTYVVTPKVSSLDIVQLAGLDGYTLALTKHGRILKLNTRDHLAFTQDPAAHTIELTQFSAKETELNQRDGLMNRFITGAFLNFAVYTRSGQVMFGNVNAEADTEPEMLPELQNRDVCKVSFGE